jgi:hypothetical protein
MSRLGIPDMAILEATDTDAETVGTHVHANHKIFTVNFC